jgi:hypothetical protein
MPDFLYLRQVYLIITEPLAWTRGLTEHCSGFDVTFDRIGVEKWVCLALWLKTWGQYSVVIDGLDLMWLTPYHCTCVWWLSLAYSRHMSGSFTLTGRLEPIADDGNSLGMVLAIHSYQGIAWFLMSNMVHEWWKCSKGIVVGVWFLDLS